MAFVQVDPKQKNATVALIVALVFAIGFLAWRLAPQDEPVAKAAQQQAQASTSAAPVSVTPVSDYDPSRNPFEKPAGLRASALADPLAGSRPPHGLNAAPISGFAAGEAANQEVASVAPLPVVGFSESRPAASGPTDTVASASTATTAQKSNAADGARFTLLATAKSGAAYTAVIRTGDSSVRVVEVGDVLGDGFKVKKLEAGLAVLSDGKETIIAKRPQS